MSSSVDRPEVGQTDQDMPHVAFRLISENHHQEVPSIVVLTQIISHKSGRFEASIG